MVCRSPGRGVNQRASIRNPICRRISNGCEEVPDTTAREALRHLVDELPDEQTELARLWLEGLGNAADEDGPLLDAEAPASLDRGLADVVAGRVKPLAEYERQPTKLRRFSIVWIGPWSVVSGRDSFSFRAFDRRRRHEIVPHVCLAHFVHCGSGCRGEVSDDREYAWPGQ